MQIAQVSSMLQSMVAAAERIFEFLEEPEEINEIEDPEKKQAAENMNKALETVNMILGNSSPEEEPKKMTQADVVVLTALNNVIFNNVEGVVGTLATISNDDAEDEDKDKASKQLMETV